jgi:GT2 family glycosyltransferase
MNDREILNEVIERNKKVGMRVRLLQHKVNKGFSSTVNTGVDASNAEFVVLLNSDVLPTKNFLESPLKELLNNDDLFAVGCMDESMEGKKIVLRGRGVGKWGRGMINHSRGEVDRNDTFWVSGGSSVFRRSIYKKLGGMDEIYNPFYWEDIDLSYRAQKAGYVLLFDKKSVVKHFHDEGTIKNNFKSSSILMTAYRNQFIFIWKNITSISLLANHFLYLPFNIYGALKRHDVPFFKGLFLAVLKLPAIIDKRQKQKKLYRISDGEIIQKIL